VDILSYADIVVILIILYFTCFGWVQGIMRFALGFLAFFISAQIGLTYFHGTQNILESLKIFFFLSITLSFLAWLGLTLWNKTVVKSQRCTPLSRFLGALVGFCWAISLVSAIMVFLVLFPTDQSFFKNAKESSQQSYFYTFVEHHFLSNYPLYKTLQKLYEQSDSALDPSSPENLDFANSIAQEDLEIIKQDSKVQEILADEQIKEMIKEKDFGRLIANPKIQDLLKDKVFVQKLLKFYSSIATGK
jgi:uncharacterized membrane protein required for colicin V production